FMIAHPGPEEGPWRPAGGVRLVVQQVEVQHAIEAGGAQGRSIEKHGCAARLLLQLRGYLRDIGRHRALEFPRDQRRKIRHGTMKAMGAPRAMVRLPPGKRSPSRMKPLRIERVIRSTSRR